MVRILDGRGNGTYVYGRIKYRKNTKDLTICLDGDGSFIMHLGALTLLGKKRKNFKYILVDNESHDYRSSAHTFKKYKL